MSRSVPNAIVTCGFYRSSSCCSFLSNAFPLSQSLSFVFKTRLFWSAWEHRYRVIKKSLYTLLQYRNLQLIF
jgi:hypothetical protein